MEITELDRKISECHLGNRDGLTPEESQEYVESGEASPGHIEQARKLSTYVFSPEHLRWDTAVGKLMEVVIEENVLHGKEYGDFYKKAHNPDYWQCVNGQWNFKG